MADLNKFHPVFYDSFTSEWEILKNLWEIQRTKKLQLIGDEAEFTGETESHRGPQQDLESILMSMNAFVCAH